MSWNETYLNEDGGWENGAAEKEQIFFDKIAIQIREAVFAYNKANGGPKRVNHAKIIAGFTNVKFNVTDALPQDLSYGFLTPGASYETTIRFSNAGGKVIADDAVPDLRGAALRLHTNNGDYDLLMTNAEIHHATTATEAMHTINAGVSNETFGRQIPADAAGKEAIFGAHYLNYLVSHAGATAGVRIANTLHRQAGLKVQSISTETFWSRAPYALGADTTPEHAVAFKFRIRPAKEKPAQEAITSVSNLAEEFIKELTTDDVVFYFEVQRYIDAVSTPIEDSSKSWPSPFEKVAEIVIPKGSVLANEEVDKLSFSPWNVNTQYFRPLGNMNRSRRKVYDAAWHERESEAKQ
jgi:hypothetical protein